MRNTANCGKPNRWSPALENTEFDELLCALIRGERPAWPSGRSEEDFHALARRSSFHGVQAFSSALLAEVDWPADLVAEMRRDSFELAVWELGHRRMLIEVLNALAVAGVQPLLFKGSALAYSLYANPLWRERGDTDMLIPSGTLEAVESVLLACGFKRARGVSGQHVSYQATYTRTEGNSLHALDVHWRISNSQVLADLFGYQDLLGRARPVAALGPHALAPCPVDALLLACMHRARHLQNPYYVDGVAYYDGDRLIWLHDVHLLSMRFNETEWREFVQMAADKGLQAACAEAMLRCQRRFGSNFPAGIVDQLRKPAGADAGSRYLFSGRMRQQWLDLRALPGTRARKEFLRELVFPDPAYMRGKYPNASSQWLGWLYLRRAFSGLRKKLRATDAPH